MKKAYTFVYASLFVACIITFYSSNTLSQTALQQDQDLYYTATNYIKNRQLQLTNDILVVSVKKQQLLHYRNNKLLKSYVISTSKKGLGQIEYSRRTPKGLHKVTQKIGDGAPINAIFKGRQYTGKVWQKLPRALHKRDHIVTRILYLEGLEPGVNKGIDVYGNNVDSSKRYIYIHGTTMEWQLGRPASIGCVHMASKDIIELFNILPVDSLVLIM